MGAVRGLPLHATTARPQVLNAGACSTSPCSGRPKASPSPTATTASGIVGLVAGHGELTKQVTNATLLVRPDVAAAQLADEEPAPEPDPDEPSPPEPTPNDPTPPAPPGPARKRHYFASKTLDADKYALDFKKVSDEVLAHLATEGIELSVHIEIEATATDGFDEGKVRTVSENATTLKFDSSTFEE